MTDLKEKKVDFTKKPKEKLNEVITRFDNYKARIDKIKARIKDLEKEVSKLDEDKDFEKYHAKNQEIEYYNNQLAIAIDKYEAARVADRLQIEGSLVKPVLAGLNATRKKADFDNRKRKIIDKFKKDMRKLEKEHNQAILNYVEELYPDFERLLEHFGDTEFKQMNLGSLSMPHYHYRRAFEEFTKEFNSK